MSINPIRFDMRPVSTCRHCGKGEFLSRKAAKRWAKTRFPEDTPRPYRCTSGGDQWHAGHLPTAIRKGIYTRADRYGPPRQETDTVTTVLPRTAIAEAFDRARKDTTVTTPNALAAYDAITDALNDLFSDLDTYRYILQVPVTPAMARRLVDLNAENNRGLSAALVDKYARNMSTFDKDGRRHWREQTGQTIKVDKKGRLIDAQHRVHAVIKSGQTIKFDICMGIEPADILHVDSGKSRNSKDHLAVAGAGDVAAVSPIVRWVIAWENSFPMGPNGRTPISPPELYDRYQRDALLFESAAARGRDLNARVVPTTIGGTGYFLIAQANPTTVTHVNDFFEQLAAGIGADYHSGSAIYVLREKLLSARNDRYTKAELLCLIMMGWRRFNQFLPNGNRKPVDTIQLTRGELTNANFPKPVKVNTDRLRNPRV